MNRVRLEGDWEEWLTFFAEGVLETAQNSVETAQRLVRIGVEDTVRIQNLGLFAGSCLQVDQTLKRRPVGTIARLSQDTSLSLLSARGPRAVGGSGPGDQVDLPAEKPGF